jgi:outer membrane protein OmpA-like peptidoglycan-associated protein
MKKIFLSSILLLSLSKIASAQDYLGLATGNYAGINGIMLQPANVADNRYKLDLNLVSTNFSFQNNYLGFTRNYFINNRFSFKDFQNFQDFKSRVLTENTLPAGEKGYFNLQNRVQLPGSMLISTGKNSGIALNISSRTGVAFNNISPVLMNQIYNGWNNAASYGTPYNMNGANFSGLNWFEVGFTYGRVLINSKKNFLKVGATGKYLGGLSSLYFNADKLSVGAYADSFALSGSNIAYGHSATTISGKINSSFRPDATAFGGDLGIVYEFRGRAAKFEYFKKIKGTDLGKLTQRRDKNKYSVKIGASLLDLGALNFTSVLPYRKYDINSGAGLKIGDNGTQINNVTQFDSAINSKIVTPVGDSNRNYSIAMPTALSLQLDLHLFSGFYVNAMSYTPITRFNESATFRTHTPDYYVITPRFETRVLGLYVPFITTDKKTFTVGTTLRLGPLFLGTANLSTLIKKDNIKNADLHVGLKLPIAYGRPSKASKWFKSMMNENDELTKISTPTLEDRLIPNPRLDVPSVIAPEVITITDPTTGITEEKIVVVEPTGISDIDMLKAELAAQRATIDSMRMAKPAAAEKAATAPTTTQPVQITINNYGEKGNNNNGNNADLNEQIEYLQYQLEQKEKLFNEIENGQKNINEDGSNKKKINELKESYLFPKFQYNNNGRSSKDVPTIAVFKTNLETIDAKNKALDVKIKAAIVENETLTKTAKPGEDYAFYNTQLNDLLMHKFARKVTIIRPLSVEKKIIVKKEIVGKNNNVAQATIEEEVIENAKPQYRNTEMIGPKETAVNNVYITDTSMYAQFRNLMTKAEYENLRKEMAAMRNEMNMRKPEVVAKDGTNTITNNTIEYKLIRDTIYVERPVIKEVIREVVRVQRDTIINTVNNTIEKTNYVPKEVIKEVSKIEYVKEELFNLPPDVILFDIAKSNVKPQYNSRLSFYATQLKKFSDIKITLTGHTDNTGNAIANKKLSERRATAVLNYFVTRGIAASRIQMAGDGADAPVAANNGATNKSQNRRVEINFSK